MKRWIRWSATAAVGLAVLAGGAAALGYQLAERKMLRKVEVAVQPVPYTQEAPALERGKYPAAASSGREVAQDVHAHPLP